MNPKSENLVWIDLEMTGLDPLNDHIIEIATVVTNAELEVIAEGPVLAIHQEQHILEHMNPWCRKQHAKSGLTPRVQQSRYTLEIAEAETLQFLEQYVKPQESPMCGNSICQDRRFLARYMPRLEQFFHYRHIDVSTVKELARRWNKKLFRNFKKDAKHLALEDIKESIAELQYYRNNFFNLSHTE